MHLTISEGDDVHAKILENTVYTNVYDEAPKEEEKLAPKEEEGTSIAEPYHPQPKIQPSNLNHQP